MATKRGGKRQGAGRKKGTKNPATKAMKETFGDLAKRLAPEALQKLARIMRSKTAPANAVVAASNSILDRAYGRPRQSHEHSGPNGTPIQHVDLSKLSGKDLDALERIISAAAVAGGNQGGEDPED